MTQRKRMTLLARKEGLSTSDFRAYWAGPHAALALGMQGIERYTQNRVDKCLWCSGEAPPFCVDGIVELSFRDEQSMQQAQASSVGSRHIPADEPQFLRGWTLCIVDSEAEERSGHDLPCKVVVAFRSAGMPRASLVEAVSAASLASGARVAFNWTASTARRQRLWCEPSAPDGFVVLWFDSVAAAHDAFDAGPLREALASRLEAGAAYLVDEHRLR